MTIVEQLARFLANKLQLPFEGTEAGAVFYGYLPEEPVKAICVYANDLRAPGDSDGTRVQIVVRSDMDGAWALAQSMQIMSELDDARDLAQVAEAPAGKRASRCLRALVLAGVGLAGNVSSSPGWRRSHAPCLL